MKLGATWLLGLLLLPCVSGAAELPKVATVDGSFTDPERHRDILYRIYFPEPLEGRYPVILFSDSRQEGSLRTQVGRTPAGAGYRGIALDEL